MRVISWFLFALILHNYSQFPLTTCQQLTPTSTKTNFVNCFKNNTYPFDDLSHIIFTPNKNSSFTSLLHQHSRNLRFTPPKTLYPEFLITPFKKSHVSTTILCSKFSGLALRIRSGGHDFEGLSYISNTPFVILDMFNLHTININIDKQIGYVEAGATLGEFYYKIQEKSKLYGFPAGICPSVGIGGHISGGGYGNLLRKYGLSVDNIIDAEIVDVNGRILDKSSMGEDLFWAIKGGGGASFGVVLSYTFGLVNVPEIVTVFKVMRFKEDNITSLVYKWQSIMYNIDKDLFIRVLLQPVIMPKNNGDDKVIMVTFMSLFLGGADRLISVMNSEFPELGLKRIDCIEMNWVESVLYWSNYSNKTNIEVLLDRSYNASYFKRKSDYVKKPISEKGLELLLKKLIELGKPGLVFNPYGGKMREISSFETPFPHRDGNLFKIQYSISWKEEGEEAERKYLGMIRELHDFMTPYVSISPRSAYLNYRDLDIGVTSNFTYEEGKVYGEKYFNGNFDRLVKVKSRVDSENFFRNEQSIPPLRSSGQKQKMVFVVYFMNAFALWFACGRW